MSAGFSFSLWRYLGDTLNIFSFSEYSVFFMGMSGSGWHLGPSFVLLSFC
jgi:hypothetical protein